MRIHVQYKNNLCGFVNIGFVHKTTLRKHMPCRGQQGEGLRALVKSRGTANMAVKLEVELGEVLLLPQRQARPKLPQCSAMKMEEAAVHEQQDQKPVDLAILFASHRHQRDWLALVLHWVQLKREGQQTGK